MLREMEIRNQLTYLNGYNAIQFDITAEYYSFLDISGYKFIYDIQVKKFILLEIATNKVIQECESFDSAKNLRNLIIDSINDLNTQKTM